MNPFRLFLLTLLLVPSPGQGQTSSLADRFDQVDRNGDGRVTAKELPRPELFDRLDRNGDGVIEKSELPGNSPAPPARSAGTGDLEMPPEPPHTAHLDLRYDDIEGVDPNLLSLDLYVPEGADEAPVMIWIHGGSWQVGDKRGPQRSPMREFFLEEGWLFASCNYRLGVEGRHPANAEDVAGAIAWLYDHVADFGGSPDGLYLMGHSAGGHLAAIVTTNGRFLEAAGKSLDIIEAVLLLDPAVLDVPEMLAGLSRNPKSPYTVNFGTDSEQWVDASPFHHIRKEAEIPPWMLFLAYGREDKARQAHTTVTALRDAVVRAELIDAFSYKSHAAIARDFGIDGDLPTESARRFLREIESSRKSGDITRGISGAYHRMRPKREVLLAGRQDIGEYQADLAIKHLDRDKDEKLIPNETREPIRQHFATIDRDGDGTLTEAEVVQAYTTGPLLPVSPLKEGDASGSADKPTPQPSAKKGRTFPNLEFTRDFVAGKDRNGREMGGTECNYIVSHNGKLFASLSCWKHDTSAGPLLGAQILVKPSAEAEWELDIGFGTEYGCSKIMRSVAFTTDQEGNPLPEPVSMLIAEATRWHPPYDVGVWTRDDTSGEWTRTVISPENVGKSVYRKGFSTEIRMLIDHIDKGTGIHHVFACTNQGKIHRGAYDPESPGRIAWEEQPELDNRLRRTSSGGVANGDLYVSIGMDVNDPENGGLFRRIDGAKPAWERVSGWEHLEAHQERNLTSELRFAPIPASPGDGADILLATQAHPVCAISRIDPGDGFRKELDLDVQKYVSKHLPGARVMSLAANGFLPVRHPDTGEQVHLGGLWLHFRNEQEAPKGTAAWYLVRYSDGTYGHGQVIDPEHPVPNRGVAGGLRDTRTICPSPFPEDRGRVFYFGGFNCGTHHIEEKLLNTAWIYRAEVPASSPGKP